MYIHKYAIGDRALYLVSDRASKPSKIMSIGPDDWRGAVSGVAASNIAHDLEEFSFRKDPPKEETQKEPEVEPEVQPEAKQDTPEETETRKKAVTELDKMAEEIQEQNPVIAYLLDRVSDQLEGNK